MSLDGPVEAELPPSSQITDLYFVGGIPVEMTEAQLVGFFSQFVTVDAVTFRASKSPASKGFGFMRVSQPCDLVALVGNQPKVLGFILSLEPAQDPKSKLLSIQRKTMHKVFVG